jgi:hypothetical protein
MFTKEITDFDRVRKEFYRLWFFAHKASQSARLAKREGREEDARGASTAFRVLSKQAKEAYAVMDSLREPRPGIIDTDVAVDEDLHYLAPEIFMAEAEGTPVLFREEPREEGDDDPAA